MSCLTEEQIEQQMKGTVDQSLAWLTLQQLKRLSGVPIKSVSEKIVKLEPSVVNIDVQPLINELKEIHKLLERPVGQPIIKVEPIIELKPIIEVKMPDQEIKQVEVRITEPCKCILCRFVRWLRRK
jgi:hypothetical protein